MNTKTYFSGDESENDFVISGSLPINFKMKTIHWFSVCSIIFTWIDFFDNFIFKIVSPSVMYYVGFF